MRERVEKNEAKVLAEPSEDKQAKRRDVGCQIVRKIRKVRKDWVGKFDSLRFSDSRTVKDCLLYTSPSPRDATLSRMPSSA